MVVGTVALMKLKNDIYSLRKMFVHANYRGSHSGLAGALLKTAENWAKSKSGVKIVLGTTEKFLAAHKFYSRNGYQPLAEAYLPADFPIMAVDKLFFGKSL